MGFMDKVKETLEEDFNVSVTENGAIGYKTTNSEILDFNYKIASYRSRSKDEIIKDFEKVFYEDKILAMQFLFFIRDREEGLGERRLFRIIIKHIAEIEPKMVKKLIGIIAEYGRFDDLLELLDTRLKKDVLEEIRKQLNVDDDQLNLNESVSLLGKWLPSLNSSSKVRRKQALMICDYLEMDKKRYRKFLSALREKIDVVEKKMSSNEWSKIKYENVPSRANLIYNNAFLKHDEQRRSDFLNEVKSGEKKIHAGMLYPHDIVHKYTNGAWRAPAIEYDETIEQLWKALPNKEIENTLVVADGSGSMTSRIGSTGITALDVANALAIYFADHNKGEFKNNYITFSETPQLVSFKGAETLRDKIKIALLHDECANTNIEKVFELILFSAKKNKVPQEEMPKNILIISDMEFDSCVEFGRDKHGWAITPTEKDFATIGKRFEEEGYKLPRIIFWNVASRTTTIPLKQNELGVALVSGFSTNIADMVMSCELDPLKVLLEKINTPRYLKVKEILEKDLQDGKNVIEWFCH